MLCRVRDLGIDEHRQGKESRQTGFMRLPSCNGVQCARTRTTEVPTESSFAIAAVVLALAMKPPFNQNEINNVLAMVTSVFCLNCDNSACKKKHILIGSEKPVFDLQSKRTHGR